jgi:hypothetical protein
MKTAWLGKIMELLTAAWICLPSKKQQAKGRARHLERKLGS